MNDLEARLGDLSAIRTMMERSTKFLSLSGLSGVSAGLVALVGACAAEWCARSRGETLLAGEIRAVESLREPLGIGAVAVLAAAGALTVLFSRRAARKKGLQFWSPAAARVLEALGIPLVAGGLFCLLLAANGGTAWIVPAMLLFYGVALIGSSTFITAEVKYLGLAELAVGLGAAAAPGYGLLWWAAGFGVLHVVYGVLAYRKYGM